MGTSNNERTDQTFKAGADLSAQQYNYMRVSDGDQQVNVASHADTNQLVGVLLNKPAAVGRHASVAIAGRAKLRAGGAIATTQTMLTVNGSGRCITAASGEMVIGRNIEVADADGDIISVMLVQPWRLSGPAT